MRMLDLCCGLKGASAAMQHRGWHIRSLDIDPAFNPDILADVRTWLWLGEPFDLVWASPPCQEFSREFFPWSRTGNPPDLSIYEACKRLIAQIHPRYWIIENTRGAVPYFGPPAAIFYPYYLWGQFPILNHVDLSSRRHKASFTSSAKAARSLIPYTLSLSVAKAVELQNPLFV